MQAFDPMNSAAAIYDDGETFDMLRDRIRARYSEAINDAFDAAIDALILPDQQAAVLIDAAQFTVFLASVVIAQRLGGDPTDRKAMMQAYRQLHLAIDRDVPTMLMQFVDAAKEEKEDA